MAFVRFVRRKFRDREVRGTAQIIQGFFHAFWIFFVGDYNFQIGVPRIIGIAVGEEVDAALTSRFDYLDVLRSLSPNAHRAELDMRMCNGRVSWFADGDF